MLINIKKLFETYEGRIIMSLIWGLGLACLFKKVCVGRNCIVYKAPNPTDIKGSTYRYNDKCYEYIPEFSECKKNAIE